MRRCRHLAPRIRPDQELEPSGRDLPQHGGDDEPVKWPDDRQIGSAKQVVRQYQRGRGDAPGMAGACDINHQAKIQVLVVKAATMRSGVWRTTGSIPMKSRAPGPSGADVFSPSGATRKLRKASSTSIHRGKRASIFSAACRASSAAPSIAIL